MNEEMTLLKGDIKAVEKEIDVLHERLNEFLRSPQPGRYFSENLRITHKLICKDLPNLRGKLNELKLKLLDLETRAPIIWLEHEHWWRHSTINGKFIHLANRERAAEELLRIHESNYRRGEGTGWVYGICASGYGWGESRFAFEYISLLSKPPLSLCTQYSVLPRLQNAVRIYIELSHNLNRERSIESLVLDELTRRVFMMTESNLLSTPDSLIGFMKSLVERSQRAIFLIIDGVARPFKESNNWSEEVQQVQLTRFNTFVKDVIFPLLQIPGLFILLCGTAPFLNWVGTQPQDPKLQIEGVSGVQIPLDLIYPNKIVEILKNTKYHFSEDAGIAVSLGTFLNLEGSSEAETRHRYETFSDRLYQLSLGHPRTLREILVNLFDDISEKTGLLTSDRPRFPLRHDGYYLKGYMAELECYKFPSGAALILNALREGKSDVNLEQIVDGRASLRHLMSALMIAVESLGNDRHILHIPDEVDCLFKALICPMREFLNSVNATRKIPTFFNYFTQLLFVKVFNQLFVSSKKPRDADPFFFSSPVFGNWDGMESSCIVKLFPSVTQPDGCKDTIGYLHVAPEDAKKILFNFFSPQGVWLIPRRSAHSPDLMYLGQKTIVCISIRTEFVDVYSEIKKAELMIPDDRGPLRSVLIIASISYDKTIQKNFRGAGFQVFPREGIQVLDEVVLLNLNCPILRSKLCRTTTLEESSAVEWILKQEPLDSFFD